MSLASSNLGVDYVSVSGLPTGFYSNGLEIGSSFDITNKKINIGATGLLSSIPTGCQGLFACKWVNNNYTGPIIKLRSSGSGSPIFNFYIDKTGTVITTLTNPCGNWQFSGCWESMWALSISSTLQMR